jgi:hypothetical protein
MMGRVCSITGEEEECIRILMGKPEGNRPYKEKGISG